MRNVMLIAAATLALAGCKKATTDEASAPAATPSMATATPAAMATMAMADMTGTWDSTAPDGTKSVTQFNADGSYKDDDAKAGKSIGRYTIKGGKVCLDPSGDKPEMCYSVGAAGADGMRPATADDGTKIMVMKRPA